MLEPSGATMLKWGMLKSKAIELLGGTPAEAARAVGVTPQAVCQWPKVLPTRLADRVLAAVARRHLPPEVLAEFAQPASDAPAEAA